MHSAVIRRAEATDGEPAITVYQEALIRHTLQDAGVEFTSDRGVVLNAKRKSGRSESLEGTDSPMAAFTVRRLPIVDQEPRPERPHARAAEGLDQLSCGAGQCRLRPAMQTSRFWPAEAERIGHARLTQFPIRLRIRLHSCAPRFAETPFEADMIRGRVTMTTERTASGAVGLAGVGAYRANASAISSCACYGVTTWKNSLAGAGRHGRDPDGMAGQLLLLVASLATRSTNGEVLENERVKAKLGEMLLERELLEAKIAAWRPSALWPAGGRGDEPDRLARKWQALRPDPCVPSLARLTGQRVSAISPPPGPNRRGVLARLGRCRIRRWSRRSARS